MLTTFENVNLPRPTKEFFLGIQSSNYVTAARYGFYSNCQQLVSSRQELEEQFNIQFQRQQLLKCLLKAKKYNGTFLKRTPTTNLTSKDQLFKGADSGMHCCSLTQRTSDTSGLC